MPCLDGRVCLVTGASRGIGKGIAVQLLTYGATVYVTGRNEETLAAIATEANSRSSSGVGKCIPLVCDHSNDASVKDVFSKINEEQSGRLDLLVNNAYSAVTFIMENAKKNFWDQPESTWDEINHVGLRNHFLCSQHAAKMMVPRRNGLIINISSIGGMAYFQTAAYGVGKGGKDRMAKDCAMELAPYNVCYVSLWPGLVKTELINANKTALGRGKKFEWLFSNGESTEYPGKAIAHLLADKNVMSKSGKILQTADVATEYGFKDIDGSTPANMRSFEFFLVMAGAPLAFCQLLPSWLKIPLFIWKILLSHAPGDMTNKEISA